MYYSFLSARLTNNTVNNKFIYNAKFQITDYNKTKTAAKYFNIQ